MIEMTVGTKLGVRLQSLLEKCLHLSEVAQKPLVFSGGNHTAIDPAELPTFLPCVKGFGAGIVFDLFLTLLDHRGPYFSSDTFAKSGK